MQNYVYFETYGCSANQNNTEIMKGILMQNKYSITNNPMLADIFIFNTCIVKGKTETKIKRKIQDFSLKYKNKLIVVSGCMPETDLHSLKKIYPKSIFLGLYHIKEISKLIKDNDDNRLTDDKQKYYLSKNHEEKIMSPKIPNNKLISITQISEGCLGNCSYCKTRLAKGTLFSYDKNKILESIRSDLNNGAKELWITSQDCASYNLDKGKQELPILLNDILKLKHNFRLRLGMMNPDHVNFILDDLIVIYKNKKMYKFLHIPIQSASDIVLKDMDRKYKIETTEKIIKRFRLEFPDITIATDIITGYPTETEDDHKKNLEFIEKYRPDVFNLSKFSSHKKTIAGKLEPLKKEIINKRATELMALHRKTTMENKQKYKDKDVFVFVNKKTDIPNVYEARDDNYNIILINSKDKSIFGKSIFVKIITIGVHHMIGDLKE